VNSNDATRSMLIQVGAFFSEKLREKVTSGRYPQAIKDGISVDEPKQNYIDVLVTAPMAAAFEYGSGIHATRGVKAKYRIPKEGGSSFVAFPKERWPGYEPPPEAPDVFVFSFVMHPGIVARPYIKPTIQSSAPQIREILGKAFKAEILLGVEREVIIE
jgi:hypothetical protein